MGCNMKRGFGAGGYLIAEGIVRLPGGTWAGEREAGSGERGAGSGERGAGSGERDEGRRTKDEGRRTRDEGGSRGKGRNSHYEAVILCGIGLTGGGGRGKVSSYVFVCQ